MAVTFAKGFKAAGVAAGIKKSGARDVAVILADAPCVAAMVGTLNQVCAPSVTRNRGLVPSDKIAGVIVNAGCANVATGPEGVQNNQLMAGSDAFLTASTGVIGVQLPMDKLLSGITNAKETASSSTESSQNAAEAIMTTDLIPKTCTTEVEIFNKTVSIGGMAKGSGMIAPNMATMLAFITTDIAITPAVLDSALRKAVDVSFNCMTVDGDTSTSDQCIILASGAAQNPILDTPTGSEFEKFVSALTTVCVDLAKKVARDGEGATKLVTVEVSGALSDADAKQVARTIAESPLVKTALFGNDPNWGRLMMAAGRAGIAFNPDQASATLAGIEVFRNGVPTQFDKTAASNAMKTSDVTVTVDLGIPNATGRATVYTCDFSYEYVKINAEYTT
jgi:glutamate N-acetyltransferase / amino-acid N-acetyltransferase